MHIEEESKRRSLGTLGGFMRHRDAAVGSLIFFLHVAATLGVISTTAAGQHEREVGAATTRQVVTGHVCLPDGSPAAGAEVATSVGGKCLSDGNGSFALEVEVPLDAESVEVTVVAGDVTGSGSLVASAHFLPTGPSPRVSVGRLVLVPASNCYPQ